MRHKRHARMRLDHEPNPAGIGNVFAADIRPACRLGLRGAVGPVSILINRE